jgi:hypothetical protein
MPRDQSTVYACNRDREPEALFAYTLSDISGILSMIVADRCPFQLFQWGLAEVIVYDPEQNFS